MDSNLPEIVCQYLSLKFSFIPLKVGEKAPGISWKVYQDRFPSLKEVEKWFGNGNRYNLGIITGKISKLLVFDADSSESIEFLERFEEFSRTTKVKTLRGIHYYFSVNFEEEIKSQKIYSERFGIFIDVKSEGGLIVAPPSVVKEHKYSFINSIENLIRLESCRVQKLICNIRNEIYQKIKEQNSKVREETKYIKIGGREVPVKIPKRECFYTPTEKELQIGESGNKRIEIGNLLSGKEDEDFLIKLRDEVLKKYRKGNRQDLIVYLTGFLLKKGFSPQKIQEVVIEIIESSGDEEKKMRLAGFWATVKKYQNGGEIKGFFGLKQKKVRIP